MPITSIPYNFNVEGIDQYVGGGQPLPAGWYLMPIVDMACLENNDKTSGHNLKLEYQVIQGEYNGRKYFENLNLWHKTSSQAVEIAEKQLSSIGHSVGIVSGNDLAQLGNIPMLVELELTAQQPDKIDQNTGNTIKGRGPQNRVIQRKPATPENIALYLNGQPANSGAAPASQAPQAAAASAAPAMNPAASAPASNPAASAPPMNPAAAAAPAPSPAPAPAGGGAPPPWQKK